MSERDEQDKLAWDARKRGNSHDEDLAFLADLVQSEEFQNQEIDRLLDWEVLQLAIQESPMSIFLPKIELFSHQVRGFGSFCDKIPVNKNYEHAVMHRIKKKARENADREYFRITDVQEN